MSIPVKAGELIPLQLQLATSNTDLFVRAYLFDGDSNPLNSGLPISLSHTSNGLYQNRSFVMPNTSFVVATYQVATDAGFSTIAPQDGSGIDVFSLEMIAQDIIRRDTINAFIIDKSPVLGKVIKTDRICVAISNSGEINTFISDAPVLRKTITSDDLKGVVKCQ